MIASIINAIRKHFADKRKQKRMQAFCEEKCFKLDGDYGFSIGGSSATASTSPLTISLRCVKTFIS
ncbi:hypothetical protein ACPRNU_22615 [Chromobacterium vaccinii]|uniref:hypothetical protein n=1 Tax=Chromobacterium vaccinii TaxID=1108595 RepID=UPI003C73BECC